MINSDYGSFSKSLITNVPVDVYSEEYLYYKKRISNFAGEAIYIYSFKKNKMLYAVGWEQILGYKDEEINMLKIVNITSPEYADFSNEINDKALQFLFEKSKDLEKYSFTIELKKIHENGTSVPLISKVGVFKAVNGRVEEIIGRSQIAYHLNFGKVMQYAAYGPDKSEFEETLSKNLFKHFAISKKEKEALSLAAQGYTFKEIASKFGVSHSAIEKRIIPLYKRFKVKSLAHLVNFARDNNILISN